MVFDKKGTVTIISQENIELSTFVQNLSEAYPKVKNDQLIVNLHSFSNLSTDDILEFLQLSNTHKEAHKSFVLVTNSLSYDEFPEEICVVPTVQEARDIIDMEEIERDIGI